MDIEATAEPKELSLVSEGVPGLIWELVNGG